MGDSEADEKRYGPMDKETVTLSSGCVFCDMKLKPTNCTDGWFHLMLGGRAVKCAIKN